MSNKLNPIQSSKQMVIAITGKGGVGKTTIAGLLIHLLAKQGNGPILAVDADPNVCLDNVLGVKVHRTLGSIREEAREVAGKGMSAGISKQQLLEMKAAHCLVEEIDFDLIAMGRPEGPGCYCYANNVLKEVLTKMSKQYPFMVIDNEAGLENLSRRIYQNPDLLVLVTDSSKQGQHTLERLHQLAQEMEINFNKLIVIFNRIQNIKRFKRRDLINSIGEDHLAIFLPENKELLSFSEIGRSVRELPNDNPVVGKMHRFLYDLGIIEN